jgi:hypothetical protein
MYSQAFLNADADIQKGQPEPRAPLLKAPVRAGAKIQFNWTPIVRMHYGPALAVSRLDQTFTLCQNTNRLAKYMAEYTPGLQPYEAKFFKIWELGYDTASRMDKEKSLCRKSHY